MVSALHAQWPGLRAAGGKDSLWVMFEANGEHGLETRVWARQIDQGYFHPRKADRQPAGVVAAAACGSSVHLFFEDGSHRRIGRQRANPQLNLPGRAKPFCLAGDTVAESLYAIAEYAEPTTLPTSFPATRPAGLRPESAPASLRPSDASTRPLSAPSGDPEGRVPRWADPKTGRAETPPSVLFRFHRNQWAVVGSMPNWFNPTDEHVLCADEGQVHLFSWSPHRKAPVRYHCRSKERWSEPEVVPLPSDATPLAAMVVNTYPVLVTTGRVGKGRAGVMSVWWAGGQWRQTELRMPGDTPIEVLPGRLQAAPYHDAIALVGQFGKKGPLQVGLWSPTDGSAREPVRPLPKWPEAKSSPLEPRLPQVVVFVVLGAVMALTIWWRQESLTRPIPLPSQIRLADLWRRLTACLVDMIPALVITAFYWLPLVIRLQHEVTSENVTQNEIAERYAVLLWPWLYIRIIYAASSGLAEYRWGTTLGKRLMHLWPLSADMTRPTPKQIAIRNLIKILELQPDLIALLVFIVLTKNRQRLGDVLAGTIVVEPASAPEE